MREVKFRGMKENGEWKYGLLTFMFGQYAIVDPIDENSVYLIEKETAGKYTNIKDKNDRETYDGDIIKFTERTINGGTITHVCQVFQSENGAWRVEGHPDFKTEHKTRRELYSVRHFCEVIGNKYENPELLKDEK